MQTIECRRLPRKKSTRYIEKVNFVTKRHILPAVLAEECRRENPVRSGDPTRPSDSLVLVSWPCSEARYTKGR